jgi:hypothetical protein
MCGCTNAGATTRPSASSIATASNGPPTAAIRSPATAMSTTAPSTRPPRITRS